ncbi:MAG: dihydroorotate dehydrogenase-like protein [Acidobacteriota bacterium]|nr:dihydroorotate dehydrogenase-like protein [Acidobacteriota bacterium]
MVDLSTQYLGFKLRNPLVVAASPLCKDITNLRHMEDCGAAAIVLHSLFEEQLNLEANELDRYLWDNADVGAEATSIFPDLGSYNIGPEGYLEHIRKAKETVSIPVIASLNGVSRGGWISYAREMQQAGADAIELNVYFIPAEANATAASIEQLYLDLVTEIRKTVTIPVAVKVGPYFSAFANMAQRLEQAGASGIVIFNRFYQPDFDLEELVVKPSVTLSDSHELLLRLHWAAMLHGHLKADVAITGGVHTVEDVVKSMMAGAKVTMLASALLKNGIGYLRSLRNQLEAWLERREYESIEQMQGSMSQRNVPNPKAFQRSNYMRVLSSYSLK